MDLASKEIHIFRDSCYFCTSIFQMFSILSLAISRKEKADLYLDPQFKDVEDYAERIRATGIFEDVRIIDSKKIYDRYISRESGLINHLQIARTYLHVKSVGNIIVPKDRSYTNIFVSSRAFIPRLYILSCYKKKEDVNVYYFDDGVGSYYGNSALQPSKLDGTLRKVLFGKKAVNFDQDRYLLCPTLYEKINGKTPYQVLPVEPFWEKEERKALLDQVFPCGGDHVLNETAVILEELSDEYFNEKCLNLLNETYEKTRQTFGADGLLVKSHPRSKGEKREGFRYYSNYALPFEILCMKNEMKEKVLIACGSTAVATPKMITDQEPYVILLYKFILHEGMEQDTLDNFFRALKNSYRDYEKVMIPGSIEEYNECIVRIKKELEK